MECSLGPLPQIKKLIIMLTPLLLGILEIWHPVGQAGKSAYESLVVQAQWWLNIHLLQLPLFGLLGLAVLLMINKQNDWAAFLSRVGIAFFLIFYTALDSIMGIAGGVLIVNARQLAPQTQNFVAQQINLLFFHPIVGGSTLSVIGSLGALGWFVGVLGLAISLKKVWLDNISFTLLILSGILFSLSHTPPTGPLGMFLFFIAILRINHNFWCKI